MIYSIQYLRAVAAIMVLIQHVATKGSQYSVGPWDGFVIGGSGVDLFFVISGFIMCQATEGRNISPRAFMIARIRRVIPLYWLLTTVALVVYLVSPGMVNRSGGQTSIWASYLLWPNGDKYLINNGWTLSYEFVFYGIFCAALLVSEGRRATLVVSVIVALVMLGAALRPSLFPLAFFLSPIMLEFCGGILAYKIYRANWLSAGHGIALLLGAIALLSAINIVRFDGYPSRYFYYGIPSVMIVMGMLALEPFFSSRPSKLFRLLGDSSYALYLTHGFVLAALGAALARFTGIPAEHPWTFCNILLLSSLVFGCIAYKWALLETSLIRKAPETA